MDQQILGTMEKTEIYTNSEDLLELKKNKKTRRFQDHQFKQLYTGKWSSTYIRLHAIHCANAVALGLAMTVCRWLVSYRYLTEQQHLDELL